MDIAFVAKLSLSFINDWQQNFSSVYKNYFKRFYTSSRAFLKDKGEGYSCQEKPSKGLRRSKKMALKKSDKKKTKDSEVQNNADKGSKKDKKLNGAEENPSSENDNGKDTNPGNNGVFTGFPNPWTFPPGFASSLAPQGMPKPPPGFMFPMLNPFMGYGLPQGPQDEQGNKDSAPSNPGQMQQNFAGAGMMGYPYMWPGFNFFCQNQALPSQPAQPEPVSSTSSSKPSATVSKPPDQENDQENRLPPKKTLMISRTVNLKILPLAVL